MEFEHMGQIFGALEVSPPMLKCWPPPENADHKMAVSLELPHAFSSENCVGICGFHLPHMTHGCLTDPSWTGRCEFSAILL